MRTLENQELDVVSGGDRWGDGQDQKNHPDPSVHVTVCTPVNNPINGSGWEICIVVRDK
jgi:hypothetical protein